MMPKTLMCTAELALCRALPDMCKTQQGRVKGLYKNLQKETDRLLAMQPALQNKEVTVLAAMIDAFKQKTGWTGRGRHVLTYVSFLLAILDGESKYSRIITILNNIVDYFDRAGKAPIACFWAGALAKKKWLDCIDMPRSAQ